MCKRPTDLTLAILIAALFALPSSQASGPGPIGGRVRTIEKARLEAASKEVARDLAQRMKIDAKRLKSIFNQLDLAGTTAKSKLNRSVWNVLLAESTTAGIANPGPAQYKAANVHADILAAHLKAQSLKPADKTAIEARNLLGVVENWSLEQKQEFSRIYAKAVELLEKQPSLTQAKALERATAEAKAAAGGKDIIPPVEIAWRGGASYPDPVTGKYVKTTASREAKLTVEARENLKGVYEYSTGWMEIFFEPGVKSVVVRERDAYEHAGDGTALKYRVGGLGKSGDLRFTVSLPVSGHADHVSRQTVVQDWAKNDRNDLYIMESTGIQSATYYQPYGKMGTEQYIARAARSLDVTTFQDGTIHFKHPGHSVILKYHRGGSGGPDLYVQSRIIEIEWDGT